VDRARAIFSGAVIRYPPNQGRSQGTAQASRTRARRKKRNKMRLAIPTR